MGKTRQDMAEREPAEAHGKIYLVTTGIYSDQRVAATFSTSEKAERFAECHPDDFADTMEMNVDEFSPRDREIYLIRITIERDGAVHLQPQVYIDTAPDEQSTQIRFDFGHPAQRQRDSYPFVLEVTSRTGDVEAAIRNANEWRTQLESTGMWPATPRNKDRGIQTNRQVSELMDANQRLAERLEEKKR